MRDFTRRKFLKRETAAAGFALCAPSTPSMFANTGPTSAVKPKLSQFDYSQVTLLEGPMLDQFTRNHQFFLALDEDGLLKPFRERAGLPAPGPVMGGWYNDSPDYDPPKNMTGYIAGHSFGQYLSGLARAYAVTGDKPTQEKVQRLVKGFGATVTEKFYTDYPLPAYTFDKTNMGLLDAYAFAEDPMALPVLSHATDAVLPHLPAGAQTRVEACALPHKNISYCWDETYTLPENFYLAYLRSGDQRYRQLAERFLQDKDYFIPLAEGDNILPGLHAYSHLNAFVPQFRLIWLMAAVCICERRKTGSSSFAPRRALPPAVGDRMKPFARPGSGDMGESLVRTHSSFETPCGSYGHFKIARYLMRITGDSLYGDSMESVLYNTILGAKPILPDGTSFYYADYNNSASKFYHQDKWPCCSGTFPQITADYGISSYLSASDGVYVNLYVPSRLTWKQNGTRFALVQTTQYPYTARNNHRPGVGETRELHHLFESTGMGRASHAVGGERQENVRSPEAWYVRPGTPNVEERRPNRVQHRSAGAPLARRPATSQPGSGPARSTRSVRGRQCSSWSASREPTGHPAKRD